MRRPKVFITHPLCHQPALELLEQAGLQIIVPPAGNLPLDQMLQHIKGVDALFWLPQSSAGFLHITKEVMDAAGPDLKIIANVGTGYDHIDMEAASEAGIKVWCTPGTSTEAVAEFTVGILLLASRRLLEGNRELMSGRWVWNPTWLCGIGLKGSTVGIFGMGRIGQGVLQRLKGFGVKKFVYNSRTRRANVSDADVEFVSFNQMLQLSDFLVIASGSSEETKGIFNADAFRLMKPTAILVNTGRGALVDQDALEVALRTAEIQAAALDVMVPEPIPVDHPLTKLSNCYLFPHMAAAEESVKLEMSMITARNIIAVLQGKEAPGRVI